jgi:hypothetical protein
MHSFGVDLQKRNGGRAEIRQTAPPKNLEKASLQTSNGRFLTQMRNHFYSIDERADAKPIETVFVFL